MDVGRKDKDKEMLNCRIHCEGTVEKVSLINLLVTDPHNSVHWSRQCLTILIDRMLTVLHSKL